MTIKECRDRKRELKRMIDNLKLMELALLRSIAIEDVNIANLRKEQREANNGRKYPGSTRT